MIGKGGICDWGGWSVRLVRVEYVIGEGGA